MRGDEFELIIISGRIYVHRWDNIWSSIHESNCLDHKHEIYVDIINGPYSQQLHFYELIMGWVSHCQFF